MVIQKKYEINPDVGYVGDLARPDEPHALESGLLYVPSDATRTPRPGDALYYNETQNRFAIPTSAAEQALVVGLLHYRRDTVVESGSQPEFANGAEIEVAVFGTFWVKAGAAMEYGQRIQWQTDDYLWDPMAAVAAEVADVSGSVDLAALNALKNAIVTGVNAALVEFGRVPITCVNRLPVAANGIAQARIGYGRIN